MYIKTYLFVCLCAYVQSRHWKAIFVGMGEQFDPDHEFTIQELLFYNLHANGHIINKVYRAALAENTIEQQLGKLRKLWQEKELKLAKHIPDSVYRGAFDNFLFSDNFSILH